MVKEDSCILESCYLSPIRRNSVLEELRVSSVSIVCLSVCDDVRYLARLGFFYKKTRYINSLLLLLKSGMTFKTGLGFVQGHCKWHHLIDRIRVPIRPP